MADQPDWPTDDMVDAAWDDALGALLSGTFEHEDMRSAIAAALAAMDVPPDSNLAVCGWCNHEHDREACPWCGYSSRAV